MTSKSDFPEMSDQERAQYGIARAKHLAFDAVSTLWRKRRNEGMKQLDIVEFTGQDRSTVSRNLRGPGNWTLRTLGQYVEALNGELEITVHAMEDPLENPTNYDAYAEFEPQLMDSMKAESRTAPVTDDSHQMITITSV